MKVHLCDRCKSIIYDAPNVCKFYSHDGEAYLHDAVFTIELCDDCFESAKKAMDRFLCTLEDACEENAVMAGFEL